MKNRINIKRAGAWRMAVTAGAVFSGLALAFWLGAVVSGGDYSKGGVVDAAIPEFVVSGQAKENLIYICPMSCISPMEKPGNCPICGMELVAAESDEHHPGEEQRVSAIHLSNDVIRSAGIRTAPVERKFVTAKVRLFGKIEYDPVEQYKVTAFAPGVIDRIYVKRAGQTVRAGDPLFDIHSPELFYLEQELFEVLKKFPDTLDYRPAQGQRYRRLMRPPTRSLSPRTETGEIDAEKQEALEKLEQIKRKMRLLGLTAKDIDTVMARGRPTGISTVTTPTTGVVQEQYAFKGSFVNTGETIFNIANPKYKWAKFEAYESDFPWIRLRQEAIFETDAFPGEQFPGKVLFLDTEFDPKTRTFTVGVLYTDPRGRLKPNMLVRAAIEARLTAEGVAMPNSNTKEIPPLVIPDSAPLITGNRAVVYVWDSDRPDRYEGREVLLGARGDGYYVVKEGIREGERVVVNGNFKIDSAVQILAKPSMMEPHSVPSTPDDHRREPEAESSRSTPSTGPHPQSRAEGGHSMTPDQDRMTTGKGSSGKMKDNGE